MVHPSQIKITRLELHTEMMKFRTRAEKSQAVIRYALRKFDNDVSEIEIPQELRRQFLPHYFKRWHELKGNQDRFLKKYGDWLAKELNFPDKCFPKLKKADQKPRGRPSKSFHDCAESSKRMKTAIIRENHSIDELVFATRAKLRELGDKATARLLHECRSTSPTRSKRILSKWKEVEKVQSRLSLEEAWLLIKKRKLSKRTYTEIRKLAVAHGHNMYPSYTALFQHQKRKRMRTAAADYQELVNDTLNDCGKPAPSQDSAIQGENELEAQTNYEQKGDIDQMIINSNHTLYKDMIPAHTTKKELFNTPFNKIEVEPPVIQFPLMESTKIEYIDMQVPESEAHPLCPMYPFAATSSAEMQAPVDQEQLTDWPMYSDTPTSCNSCNL